MLLFAISAEKFGRKLMQIVVMLTTKKITNSCKIRVDLENVGDKRSISKIYKHGSVNNSVESVYNFCKKTFCN